MFRECGPCYACCSGKLRLEVYGLIIENRRCPFHCGKCTIYNNRPVVCRNYQCAWSQGLFPLWMRPDECGYLISVENWTEGQFLRAINLNLSESAEVIKSVKEFCEQHDCPYIINHQGEERVYGTDAFIRYLQSKTKN